CLPHARRRWTRSLSFRFLCLEVAAAQPQPSRVPHHVCAQEKLNEAAPNILPPVADAHVEEQTSRRPWGTAAGAPHEQAWPPIRERARVRGGRTEEEALQYLSYGHLHGQWREARRRAGPIGRHTEGDVVSLTRQEFGPAIGIEMLRLVEACAVVRGVVETQHCPLLKRGAFIEHNVRRGDPVRDPE